MPNFGPVIGEGGQANNDQNSQDGKPPYVNSTPGISVLPFSNIDFGAYGRPNEHISTVPMSGVSADSNTSDDSNAVWTPWGDVDVSKSIGDAAKLVTDNLGLTSPGAKERLDKFKSIEVDPVQTKSPSSTEPTQSLPSPQLSVAPPKSTESTEQLQSFDPKTTSSPGTSIAQPLDIKTNTMAMQEMFKSSPEVKALLGKNFTGKIDGGIGNQTNSFANEIEHRLAEILGTNKVFGQVLSTTPEDVSSAISLALSYRNKSQSQLSTSQASIFTEIPQNRSNRIYELSKILIKSHKV